MRTAGSTACSAPAPTPRVSRRRTRRSASRWSRAVWPSARTPGCGSCSLTGTGRASRRATVASRAPSSPARRVPIAQSIVVAAGRNDGIRVDDPVVTQDGLVGKVSRVESRTARVTLLTDDQSAASALDVETDAFGIVRPGSGPRSPLRLDRVPKEAECAMATRSSPRAGARRASRRSTRGGSASAG